MVEISDFKFVNDVTIENELPDYVVGFIAGGCENYTPPPGYKITSCYLDGIGSMIVGNSIHSNLSRIRLEQEKTIVYRTLAIVGGILLAALAGIYVWHVYKKHN